MGTSRRSLVIGSGYYQSVKRNFCIGKISRLVPTVSVGTHIWTLCVRRGSVIVEWSRRDAERRKRRSHGDRGNEGGSRCSLFGILQCSIQNLPHRASATGSNRASA